MRMLCAICLGHVHHGAESCLSATVRLPPQCHCEWENSPWYWLCILNSEAEDHMQDQLQCKVNCSYCNPTGTVTMVSLEGWHDLPSWGLWRWIHLTPHIAMWSSDSISSARLHLASCRSRPLHPPASRVASIAHLPPCQIRPSHDTGFIETWTLSCLQAGCTGTIWHTCATACLINIMHQL